MEEASSRWKFDGADTQCSAATRHQPYASSGVGKVTTLQRPGAMPESGADPGNEQVMDPASRGSVPVINGLINKSDSKAVPQPNDRLSEGLTERKIRGFFSLSSGSFLSHPL